MKLVDLLGWLVFGYFTVCCFSKYGTDWDLSGRYCTPRTLLSPDGKTYPDGTPVDEITLCMAKRGIDQEFWLVVVPVLLVLIAALVVKKWRRTKAFDRELRRIGKMRRDDKSG